jgi:hypothetical protein
VRWFRRRVDAQAEADERLARALASGNFLVDKAAPIYLAKERQERIHKSALRIAEQLYSTYRLASILANTPDPADHLDTLDDVIAEAVEAATKIEDGLHNRKEPR